MEELTRTWRSKHPLDVEASLSVLARGRHDVVHRRDGDLIWRTTHTLEGPVTMVLRPDGDTGVIAHAWGAGAKWQLDHIPELFGEYELNPLCYNEVDRALRQAPDPKVRDAYRRFRGLRVPRTNTVFESLVFAVLEQKVVGLDATASRRRLIRKFGHAAHGPAPEGMMTPPDSDAWRLIASWDWHEAGVDAQRSRTIVGAARYAGRIEETRMMDRVAAQKRLAALPGIGEWTIAEIAKTALGDADAVSVRDYHLGRFITWALTGRLGGKDEDMLALLAPYRPFRQVVIRLLEMTQFAAMPRRAPRMARVDHRHI